ncbi:hypothetical protein ACSBL2_09440 [Pedobacter sp. AW31-3R]
MAAKQLIITNKMKRQALKFPDVAAMPQAIEIFILDYNVSTFHPLFPLE